VRAANHTLRFGLELALLASLAYWAWWELGGPARWLAAIAAPLPAVAFWGTLLAPKSARRLHDPARLAAEVAVFGAGIAALWRAVGPAWGLASTALIAAHLLLTFVLAQRRPHAQPL
jgi:Protein of unknown function (DUF2568)